MGGRWLVPMLCGFHL